MVLSFCINKLSTTAAQAIFWAYAAGMGLSMSTIFLAFTATSIAQTFFSTAAAFLGLRLYGYPSKKALSGLCPFPILDRKHLGEGKDWSIVVPIRGSRLIQK